MRYVVTPWREQYIKRALEMTGCIFCEALKLGSDRRALILHRGRTHFIILNRYPYNPGHLMIAPFRHTAAYERTSPAAAAEMAGLLKLAIRVLRAHYRPQGFNVGMNLGRSAGAGVTEHYHLHVVPRWTGDSNFMPLVGRTKMVTEDLGSTYERLSPLFQKGRTRSTLRTRQQKNPTQSR
jgi:ATP adenylyltransferase